jgi:hypothetical protein
MVSSFWKWVNMVLKQLIPYSLLKLLLQLPYPGQAGKNCHKGTKTQSKAFE